MSQESQPTSGLSSLDMARQNATDARKWGIRHTHARNRKSVPSVFMWDTITVNVKRQYQIASCAEDHTNRSAGNAECVTVPKMHKTFQILQLNVRKQREVQHSLMSDEQLKDCGVLAISEPYARIIDGTLVTVPMGHPNWTKMGPTVQRGDRWAFRSMLWIRKDIEAEQVPVQSSDLTAALLRLPDRSILVVSVYVEPQDAEALTVAICELHQVIRETRSKIGTRVDVVLAEDFNRHDQLWGGADVSRERQGEADPIIDLMNEHALHRLLPRGTKTWQRGNHESTIDLVLASEELATSC